MCDLESIGDPSMFKIILSVASLVRMLRPTFDLSGEENAERRKLKVVYDRCTPEVVRERSVSRRVCKNRRRTNSLYRRPDVLAISVIKKIS